MTAKIIFQRFNINKIPHKMNIYNDILNFSLRHYVRIMAPRVLTRVLQGQVEAGK